MSKTQPARGMRDFLPSDVRKREYVIKIIKEVYESYGFEPLETPSVENLETLTGKYGEEGSQLIFKILKRGEKLDLSQGEKGLSDLALRYDLTVPLARVVANYKNDLPKFFKRYQIQPVWRADRPARGRFREFYQCDVDTIGSKSMLVEAEQISAVCEILERLGFKDFVVRINHREILNGMLNVAGIPSEKHIDALTTIDKLDKIGIEGVERELHSKGFIGNKIKDLLGFLLLASNENNRISLHEIANFFNDGNMKRAIGHFELEQIRLLLNEILELKYFRIDPSLARGLSYYTGAIFEVGLSRLDFTGSLGGGGRYDGLIGMFGKEEIPACGFSLGLERILVVMEERGMFQKLIDEGKLKLDSADVMIALRHPRKDDGIMSQRETTTLIKLPEEAVKLARELRKQGLRVLVYPEADKLAKQFKYADSINIPFVCVLGESELAENKVTLKNMQTGERETLSREEIAEKVKI
jgi:histidyl-tRNA synthetase